MDSLSFSQEAAFPNYTDPLFFEIKKLFLAYFDHPWLINIIDELPEKIGSISSIRTFLALSSIHPLKESIVLNGITSLKTMVRVINIWLIPDSTDIFGISAFTQNSTLPNRKLRKCVAYTLPSNTTNMAMLIEDLEKEIIKESLVRN